MSFTATEISNSDGLPVILYQFQRDGIYWRYAASDENVTLSGNTYTALAISHDSIVQSGETTQDEFKISVPITLSVAQQYLNNTPSSTLNVTVRRLHRGDTEAPVIWVGTLDRVKAINDATAEMICRNALATLARGGLRLGWTRQCTHMLHDSQCKVLKDSFRRDGFVTAITGLVVTSPGLAGTPVGALLGGYIEWTTAEGYVERRTVVADGDGTVTVLGTLIGLEVGDAIIGYFGCPRTAVACDTIFSNLANYGGFPHIPEKSPFDGDPVF